jgi:hypothetical protein
MSRFTATGRVPSIPAKTTVPLQPRPSTCGDKTVPLAMRLQQSQGMRTNSSRQYLRRETQLAKG